MKERNTAVVLLLSLFTCAIYNFYYLYVTTQELMEATEERDIAPATELILSVVSCGLFGGYIEYRNQQLIDRWYVQRGLAHEPKANVVGLLNLAALFVCFSGFAATYFYQEELNELATHLSSARHDRQQPETLAT
jgi:hypothetical protein